MISRSSAGPVVWGDRVYVTCSSGYGNAGAPEGDPRRLARHLACVNRADGTIRWQRSIPADLPEDAYEGFLTEPGYAGSTPVTDGGTVVAFFGKSGVIAFDSEGAALELAYGTPALVTLADGSHEIVAAMPEEVWGLAPATGKLRWHARHGLTGNVSPSVLVDGDVVYVFGGFRSAGSFAIRAGGEGDVTKTHVLWTSRTSSSVATPLVHDGHLYWIDDRGQAFCASSRDGTQVYRERVAGIASGGRPVYASPVIAGSCLFLRSGRFVYCIAPAP